MKNRSLLIALLIGFIGIWIEYVKREKKEKEDKIAIVGTSLSVLGITIVFISSFFA